MTTDPRPSGDELRRVLDRLNIVASAWRANMLDRPGWRDRLKGMEHAIAEVRALSASGSAAQPVKAAPQIVNSDELPGNTAHNSPELANPAGAVDEATPEMIKAAHDANIYLNMTDAGWAKAWRVMRAAQPKSDGERASSTEGFTSEARVADEAEGK